MPHNQIIRPEMTNKSDDNHTVTEAKLVIDFGNTLTKVAIFQGNDIVEQLTKTTLDPDTLFLLKEKYSPSFAISASVIDIPEKLKKFLEENFKWISLQHSTPVPVHNHYKTAETLGSDRLAMVVAAAVLIPRRKCLVIGTGTCITYDFIDETATYFGGAISPGINMRFQALHNFTSKLPLVSFDENAKLTGTTTKESVLSGVINGVIAEVDGVIDRYRMLYGDIEVVLTGGDMNFFRKTLKNRIFAVSNLVLSGLNLILEFNVKEK